MGLPGPIIEDNAGDLVFDLTADSCGSGSVRVVHFHIGDDDDRDGSCMSFPNGVRATIAEIPDETALETILLDSGADASVFPMSLMDAGTPISPYGTKLCDAQGKSIPIESMRLVEIRITYFNWTVSGVEGKSCNFFEGVSTNFVLLEQGLD